MEDHGTKLFSFKISPRRFALNNRQYGGRRCKYCHLSRHCSGIFSKYRNVSVRIYQQVIVRSPTCEVCKVFCAVAVPKGCHFIRDMRRLGSSDNLNQIGFSSNEVSLDSGSSSRQITRPKSTPSTFRSKTSLPYSSDGFGVQKKPRPKTAIEPSRSGVIMTNHPKRRVQHCCDRVHQVEHESTRRHAFEPHHQVKKPPITPWQQKLDASPSPQVVAPGYILSRSKSKVAMYIKTDDFFNPQQDLSKSRGRGDLQRDNVIAELQQQIDDLKLFLEEEKLNHRETKRKGGDLLRDRLNELENEHENSMRIVVEQYEEQLQKVKQQNKDVLSQHVHAAETNMVKQTAEIEFLHGAFESYKSRLHQEMEDKWKKKEESLKHDFEKEILEKIHDVKTALINEYAVEKNEAAREHEREIQKARKEHKKELDSLLRRFSNAAADMEKLKETDAKMREMEAEYESMKTQYDLVCTELGERTKEITETKVQLITFEQTFQERVREVDERYKVQVNDLMVQNTELRRLYVKKCGQLFDEKAANEVDRVDKLANAKDTMKVSDLSLDLKNKNSVDDTERNRKTIRKHLSKSLTVIRARERAHVNLAATDLSLENEVRVPKERPASAPHTWQEDREARLGAAQVSTRKSPRNITQRPKTTRGRLISIDDSDGRGTDK